MVEREMSMTMRAEMAPGTRRSGLNRAPQHHSPRANMAHPPSRPPGGGPVYHPLTTWFLVAQTSADQFGAGGAICVFSPIVSLRFWCGRRCSCWLRPEAHSF